MYYKEVTMRMEGDGPDGQPAEGVSMEDLVGLMADGEEPVETPDEPASDEADESESEEVEEQDDPEAHEDPIVVLKHDGKEISLKQSEVVELAQKGFDYTQKTMAVAEESKAARAAREQADQVRQQHETKLNEQVAALQAFEKFLSTQVGNPPPVEWAQTDVAYYIAQKELYESRKGQLEQARSDIANLQQDHARSRQAWIAQQANETEKALRDTLPDWNDKTLDTLIEYAGKHGVGEKVFDTVLLQKGFWELANKAKKYDELLEKKATMKPVNQLPKVSTPQARNQQPPQLARRQEAIKRYEKAPSIQNLADLL